MIDRDAFFARVCAPLFGGVLTTGQTEGCNAILDAWEARPDLIDRRWLAYMLATPFVETDRTMQPIGEYGGNAYFFRMYDKAGDRPAKAAELGNTEPGDGARFHGRGYVQLTGRKNYVRMAALTGADLVGHPELAIEPKIAALIMFEGMKGGLFTGVGLSRYFNDTTDDPVGARAVINGTDRAEEIANIHRGFLAALQPNGSQVAATLRALSKGDTGPDVVALQKALGITPDGSFGPKTDAAVRMFQTDQGLVSDGIVGAMTRRALGI